MIGLLGLLQTMAMYRRERPLRVFGPRGIVEFIVYNQRILRFRVTYEIHAKTVRRGTVFDSNDSKYRVRAERSKHSTTSYAYIFEEKEKPGKFDPREAIRLGVPEGPLWSELQHGKKVKSPLTKKVVFPEQVLGPPRPGIKVGDLWRYSTYEGARRVLCRLRRDNFRFDLFRRTRGKCIGKYAFYLERGSDACKERWSQTIDTDSL